MVTKYHEGHAGKIGWACGMGMERLAMVVFGIKDIRSFWMQDKRLLDMFKGWENKTLGELKFRELSKYPSCFKDISFYLNNEKFNELEMLDIIRNVGGDLVENVKQTDEFIAKAKHSLSYRITYRSMER